MAATEPILRSGGVGVPFGEVHHTPRARQYLAGADCAAAENHPTGMGDVSDHATHPCQSIPAGRNRSEVGRRSTRPRACVNLDVYTVAALDQRQDAVEVLESALARRGSA